MIDTFKTLFTCTAYACGTIVCVYFVIGMGKALYMLLFDKDI